MKSQSRRAVRFGSLFLVVALVLAACDSGGETTDTTTGGTGEGEGEESSCWYGLPVIGMPHRTATRVQRTVRERST